MISPNSNQFFAICTVLFFAFFAGACAEATLEDSSTNQTDQADNQNGDNNGSMTECSDDTDCPGDEICVFEDPDAQGQCELAGDNDDNSNGDAADGEICSDSSQCDSGQCIDDICVSDCENDAHCLQGWTCDDDGLCQPPACTSNDDCAADQVCAVTADDQDDGLETVCLADNDGAGASTGCQDHGDCQSRYCLDGSCTAPCDDDDQCGTNQLCEETSISLDDRQDILPICVPMTVQLCDAPIDCDSDNMTCNAPTYGADGDVDGASCGYTNPGQNDVGASCSASAQCESNFCRPTEDQTTGECTVFCEDSQRDCADSQVCARVTEELGICAQSCSRNADCDGGNICALGAAPDGTLFSYCEQTVGDKETGQQCTTDSECESAICLSNVLTYDIDCIGDSQCPDDAECGCPPTDPGCSQHVCFEETTQCSELCDPANGDADCDGGDHDMTRCADDVSVTTETGVQTAAMCAPGG